MNLLLLLPVFLIWGQETNQIRAERILNDLEGTFRWEIWNLAQTELKRTGITTKKRIDPFILSIDESFDNSTIKMDGFSGYDVRKDRFFSVSVFNVDPGPHIMYGQLTSVKKQVEFEEQSNGTKHILTIISEDEHQWKHYIPDSTGGFKPGNQLIIFKRAE